MSSAWYYSHVGKDLPLYTVGPPSEHPAEQSYAKNAGASLFFHEVDPIAAMMKIPMGTGTVAQLALTQSVSFAYQLHKITGYPMECLCEPVDPDMPFDPWYARVIHAYCRVANTFVDARGRSTDREQFFLPWAGLMVEGNETFVLTEKAVQDSMECCCTEKRIAEQLDSAKAFILDNYHEFIIK